MATSTNPELWYAGSHGLWTHDPTLTAGFWGCLGFAIGLGAEPGTGQQDVRLRLACGGVELTYAEEAALDPWSAVIDSVDVAVTNADLLHAELYAADVMPDGEADLAEVRARWASDRDVSRLGPPGDTDDGLRAFVVVDPSGDVLRCGHPL